MTAQAKPTVEGVDNVPLEENQYEEEETTESVLGIIIIIWNSQCENSNSRTVTVKKIHGFWWNP